eukprot:3264277-Rhodomonas_salina.1
MASSPKFPSSLPTSALLPSASSPARPPSSFDSTRLRLPRQVTLPEHHQDSNSARGSNESLPS